ncbi:MAG: TfoX/Sxy family protein [Candidatus Riflebacteria bacterium]|jgi:TfoX/Sxy family transcriptional regulator of competence genes|nr:TfoX/Sxy family protein [Candidatus Riflebacteria bacterium]
MASDADYVEFIVDQIECRDRISYRKMFGEYAVYYDNKVVLLICDNRCFVKPTPGGRAHIGEVTEAPAYPGAKPSFVIEDRLEDREWFTELVKITARELPEPKPKKKKAKL